ncbi:MAG: peptide ABC transporter substrate-binding protein, partial [Firmicutes bacterium]|nr:peptide ABC transporter substrate-binding protein [Bacillota bacterium]
MKKWLVLLLALALVFTFAACGATEEGGEEAAEETSEPAASDNTSFTFSLTSVPSIDPVMFDSSPCQIVDKMFMEGLIRLNGEELNPGIAESWEFNEDNTQLTFHLRQDAVWSDGQPVTANDFVYSFKRLADPETAAPYSWVLGDFVVNANAIMYGEDTNNDGEADSFMDPNELGVSAPDDYTFVIDFETPAPFYLSFLDMPCFYPARQDLYEQYGKEYATAADKMVCNGPFVVSEYTVDQKLVLTKNDQYWDADSVKLTDVTCLIGVDTEAAQSMLQTGDLDMAETLATETAAAYIADPSLLGDGIVVDTFPPGAEDWWSINVSSTANPILGNKDFRLALNYGLDREQFITITTDDVYEPATRFVMPLVAGDDGFFVEQYPIEAEYPATADLDKAQEYLKAAMDAMGISDPSQITISLKVADSTPKLIAENCQAQWTENLGINVNIETVTYKAMLADRREGNFDLVYAGWIPDYNDPYTYLGYFM